MVFEYSALFINYHQFIIFICLIDLFYFSKTFSIFRNTSIIHQISKFFFLSPKFSIQYPSGSNQYAYFRRSEHKIIFIIMRRNQICVQIFRSVRKLFRKIAKNTKKTAQVPHLNHCSQIGQRRVNHQE